MLVRTFPKTGGALPSRESEKPAAFPAPPVLAGAESAAEHFYLRTDDGTIDLAVHRNEVVDA